jgi:hypothetical protein
MKHKNPYMIRDVDNFLEVSANSSHPELNDAKRIWQFNGYRFDNEDQVAKFFESEGLDLKQYDFDVERKRNMIQGKDEYVIHIKEKWKTKNNQALRNMKV